MAKITMPVEAGNRAVQDGTIGKVVQQTAERWKPEAMYFTTFDGRRTMFCVFDMPASSDLPPFAEPFFTQLHAEVIVSPAMNGDDLQTGLALIG